MRIMIFCEGNIYMRTGENEIVSLIEFLMSRHSLLLVCDKRFERNIIYEYGNTKMYALKRKIHIENFLFDAGNNMILRFINITLSIPKCLSIAKKFDVQLLYTENDISFLSAYFIHKMVKKPVIFRKISLNLHTWFSSSPNYLLAPLLFFIEKKILSFAPLLLSNTSSFIDSIKRAGITTAVKIIPTGCDSTIFRPFPEEDVRALRKKYGFRGNEQIIVFVGALTQAKGITDLLEAFAGIAKTNNNLRLLIVGDGPLRLTLENRVNSLNLTSQVMFIGVVPHLKVPELLNISDVFALPSKSELGARAPLEAMACGKPIIGTIIPAFRSLIIENENGFLSPPEDIEALKENLLRFNDEELKKRFGKKSLELAQDYSMTSWLKEIEKFLLSCVK